MKKKTKEEIIEYFKKEKLWDIIEQRCYMEIEYNEFLISDGFTWSETEEGFLYWNVIHQRYLNWYNNIDKHIDFKEDQHFEKPEIFATDILTETEQWSDLNLISFLKQAPKNVILYSKIWGWIQPYLQTLIINGEKTIVVRDGKSDFWFDKYGRVINSKNGDVIIFPGSSCKYFYKYNLIKKDLPKMTPVVCFNNDGLNYFLGWYFKNGEILVELTDDLDRPRLTFDHIIPLSKFNIIDKTFDKYDDYGKNKFNLNINTYGDRKNI